MRAFNASCKLGYQRFLFYSKTPKAIEETTKQAKTKQLINYYYEKHFIYTFCYSDLN